MCDNIDGSTTFVTTFCCNAINFAFARMQGTEPVMDEEGLWGLDQDPFLSRTEPEFIVDACLVGITVISYILPERKDLT